MTWNLDDSGKDTIETIAQRRQWQLEKLESNTELLAQYVRDEHEAGANVLSLAKRAGVSRPTIYRWVSGQNSDAES